MKIGTYVLTAKRPAIMGILNVTPDSFSDGNLHADAGSAIDHALRLVEEGADIIDVGGESTRPGASEVPADEETRRVVPVIEGIRRKSQVPISVDTTKSSVAGLAIEKGADMINDVGAGRFDPDILDVAARARVPICLMHMKGTPRTMQTNPQYEDLIGEIYQFLEDAIERAVKSGVDRDKVIVDPGIGFGKAAEDNIEIIKRVREFCKLGAPVLIGPSRKSFIGKLLNLGIENRLEPTLAACAAATDGGASILRVHDVGPMRRFMDMRIIIQGA